TPRSAERTSLGGPIRPTSVPAQQSPTNLYIKPELARTHIRQSSSRSYPGRTLRKVPSRPSGGAPASPVGPRSAGRSGPCRSRSGRGSASSGQKRTVSLFTFEDRETAPAFDQELCSNVGRSAQA